MSVHDLDQLALDGLEGYEARLNEPGGAEYFGRVQGGRIDAVDLNGRPAPAGAYELSFRERGTTAWHNDARLPTYEVA